MPSLAPAHPPARHPPPAGHPKPQPRSLASCATAEEAAVARDLGWIWLWKRNLSLRQHASLNFSLARCGQGGGQWMWQRSTSGTAQRSSYVLPQACLLRGEHSRLYGAGTRAAALPPDAHRPPACPAPPCICVAQLPQSRGRLDGGGVTPCRCMRPPAAFHLAPTALLSCPTAPPLPAFLCSRADVTARPAPPLACIPLTVQLCRAGWQPAG